MSTFLAVMSLPCWMGGVFVCPSGQDQSRTGWLEKHKFPSSQPRRAAIQDQVKVLAGFFFFMCPTKACLSFAHKPMVSIHVRFLLKRTAAILLHTPQSRIHSEGPRVTFKYIFEDAISKFSHILWSSGLEL